MENELYKLLIQYGGATTIIAAMILFVDKLGKVWSLRKNGTDPKLYDRVSKIEGNDLVHLSQDISDIKNEIIAIRNSQISLREDYLVFKQKVGDALNNFKK